LTNDINFDEAERLGTLLEKTIAVDSEIIESRRAGIMFVFDMEYIRTCGKGREVLLRIRTD
jgi:hypothetical protein